MAATEVRVLELPPTDLWEILAFPAVLVVLGGVMALVGAGVMWRWQESSRRKEEREEEKKQLAAILMLFLDEFVEAFSRCVLYCTQARLPKPRCSHSSLYLPTDARALMDFVRLCSDMTLHETVFFLKKTFFQVQNVLPRLADAYHRSGGFPPGWLEKRVPLADPTERERMRYTLLASQYQSAAVAFFIGEKDEVYDRLVPKLSHLIAAARAMEETDKGRIVFLRNRLLKEHKKLVKIDPRFAHLTKRFSDPQEQPPVELDEEMREGEESISGHEPEEPGTEPRPQGADGQGGEDL